MENKTVTAEEASASMRLSRALFLTRNGKPFSHKADDYTSQLKSYNKFCKKNTANTWDTHINALMETCGIVSDAEFSYRAFSYESAGEMLKFLSQSSDSNRIQAKVIEQGHSGSTISSLAQLLLIFSDKGLNFVDKVFEGTLPSYLKGSYKNAQNSAIRTEKYQQLQNIFTGLLVKTQNEKV